MSSRQECTVLGWANIEARGVKPGQGQREMLYEVVKVTAPCIEARRLKPDLP